ncbi:MAG: pilus assembly protein [Methylobacteriaceae bacterium]|nr:pilus assembly protein [Methylobacteriaceae bacterium]
MSLKRALRRSAKVYRRDESGAAAVEFALVAAPFILILLATLQIGLFYLAQSALDAGVIKTADALRTNFSLANPATSPDAATLKDNVKSNAGPFAKNASQLAVEIRPVTGLAAASVPVTDGTADYGTTTSILVLRAVASVPVLWPGLSQVFQARASAIVRRQGR